MKISILLALAAGLHAQSMTVCKAVYVAPMPEALDGFVVAELVKWGGVTVVTDRTRADCELATPRQNTSVDVGIEKAGKGRLEVQDGSERLPRGFNGLATYRAAAVSMTAIATGTVVWATTKTDAWSSSQGPHSVAKKLVDQLKKDYAAARKR